MDLKLCLSLILAFLAFSEAARGGGRGRFGGRKGQKYGSRVPVMIIHKNPASASYYEHKDGAKIVKSSHFELDYMLGRKITFFCMATGVPRPEITWFKDGIELYAHKFFQETSPFSPDFWDSEYLEQDVDLSDMDDALRHEMEAMLARRLQLTTPTATVTLKFILNTGECLTTAHEQLADFKSIKEEIAPKFNTSPDNLRIFQNDTEVCDTKTPADLGVSAFSSAEFRIESKDPRTELKNNHLVLPTPDIITVDVDGEQITVEMENRAIRKPFLGGFRNKYLGLEYHNAATQTGPALGRVSRDKKFSRDTQTAATTSKATSTWCEKFTQSGEVPYPYLKLIEPGAYKPSKGNREEAARIIQRFFRIILLCKRVKQLSRKHRELKDKSRKHDKEIETGRDMKRMAHPKTKEDFDVLYMMVDRWRKAETERISKLKTEAPKKAELCTLLDKEVKLLESIEAHRIKAREEREKEKARRILAQAGKPVEWTSYKGVRVTMDTLRAQRARELAQLYDELGEDAPPSLRVERLLTLKHTLSGIDTPTTNELTELLEREAELLTRGVKGKQLDFLRARTQQLFIKFFKEADVYETVREKCHIFCPQCQKMRSRREFSVSARDPVANICNSCKTSYGESRTAQDFRHILRAVRRDEQHRGCFSSCSFLMSEEDMAFLAGNIWHGKSAVSGTSEVKILRFPRWDREQDWTPWNCILLTTIEARLHEQAGHKQYGEHLVHEIRMKHALAKSHFGHLQAVDERIRDRGLFNVHEWPMGNDTMKSKMEIDPTTQKDAGYYECQADNQYSIDRRGFRTDYVIYTY